MSGPALRTGEVREQVIPTPGLVLADVSRVNGQRSEDVKLLRRVLSEGGVDPALQDRMLLECQFREEWRSGRENDLVRVLDRLGLADSGMEHLPAIEALEDSVAALRLPQFSQGGKTKGGATTFAGVGDVSRGAGGAPLPHYLASTTGLAASKALRVTARPFTDPLSRAAECVRFATSGFGNLLRHAQGKARPEGGAGAGSGGDEAESHLSAALGHISAVTGPAGPHADEMSFSVEERYTQAVLH